jgi:hypothetical protein
MTPHPTADRLNGLRVLVTGGSSGIDLVGP